MKKVDDSQIKSLKEAISFFPFDSGRAKVIMRALLDASDGLSKSVFWTGPRGQGDTLAQALSIIEINRGEDRINNQIRKSSSRFRFSCAQGHFFRDQDFDPEVCPDYCTIWLSLEFFDRRAEELAIEAEELVHTS